MGNCMKCGNETKYAYTYHTGDVADERRLVSEQSITTTTLYTNLQSHSEFLCTKCSYTAIAIVRFVNAIVFIAIYLAIELDLHKSNADTGLTWFSLGVLFSLPALFFFITGLQYLGKIKKDERCIGELGNNTVINLHKDCDKKEIIQKINAMRDSGASSEQIRDFRRKAKKEISRKRYFTPSQYLELKKTSSYYGAF